MIAAFLQQPVSLDLPKRDCSDFHIQCIYQNDISFHFCTFFFVVVVIVVVLFSIPLR